MDSGKLGTPELVKKFTSDIKQAATKYVKTKKEGTAIKKKAVTAKTNNLFKMSVGETKEL